MLSPFKALYIHVPFCVKRCAYCDFKTSAVERDCEAIDSYMEKMVISLRRASKAGLLNDLETIYVGGGTPTHIGHARLTELLYAISTATSASGIEEFTIEANPESFNEAIAKDARALGVTRISIGVQSLDDSVLKTLGRAHDAKRALEAIALARSYFSNVSADVICGVMGQSESSLASTVKQLIDAGVSHASIYPLIIEEGTPLCEAIERGELDDVDDDVQAEHMLVAGKILEEAGFSRYEVASYAKNGLESKNNCAYWTGKPYLGLGFGASSMLDAADLTEVFESGALSLWMPDGYTTEDAPSAARARIALSEGKPEIEMLSAREAACEDAMLGMRMSRGISQERMRELAANCPQLEDAFARVIEEGLAIVSEGRVAPTEKGWLLGNELYGELWGCAED